MKTFLIVLYIVRSVTVAADEPTARARGSQNSMGGWVPPKTANVATDKQEIAELFQALEAAGKKGDLDAAADLVDFPVLMITDDSKGDAKTAIWDRKKWTDAMKPLYEARMGADVTHKLNIFLLSDSLASIDDVFTVNPGKATATARSAALVIRTDGKWRVKAMVEGGWGDAIAKAAASVGTKQPGRE